MSKEELKILSELVSEYELRARYNNDIRDYQIYSVLIKLQNMVIAELKAEVEKC